MSTAHRTPSMLPRVALAALAMVLPLAAVAITRLLWTPRLPASVAFHWDAAGRVDGTVATTPLSVIALVGTGLGMLIGLLLLRLPRLSLKDKRDYLAWAGGLAGLSAAAWLVPAGVTAAAGSVADAELGGWIIALMLSAFYGLVPRLLLPEGSAPSATPAEPVALGATETGAWSRTVTVRALVALVIVLAGVEIAIFAPMLLSGQMSAGLVIGGVAALVAIVGVAAFAIVRVTVDWRGLRAVSLLTRVPLMHVPLDRIRKTEVTQLRAGDWGGAGLRMGPGRRALILRSGEGLVVTDADGDRFAVTLDRPQVPAGLLAALARTKQGERERDGH